MRTKLTASLLAIVLSTTSPANNANAAKKLAHWWQANGNTTDTINGKSGSLINGTTYTTGNWGGQAFDFNGINNGVELESGNLIGQANAKFTIAVWVNLAATPQNSYYTLAEFTQVNNNQLLFTLLNNFVASGEFISLEFRGYTQYWVPISLDSLVGGWNLLVAQYNGGDKGSPSSFAYYLNGARLTGTPVNVGETGPYPTNDNRLGFDHDGIDWYYGLMDDIQIYNFVLNSAQVQSLVTNETLPGLAAPGFRTSRYRGLKGRAP
jgi:hypothetical protein